MVVTGSDQADDADVLRRALDKLDPFAQRALTLVYFGGQTQDQAARQLAVSRKAVGAAMVRAMRVVAEFLESQGRSAP